MGKGLSSVVKTIVKKVVVNSANTTSSFFAHQVVAPKSIEKFKKK